MSSDQSTVEAHLGGVPGSDGASQDTDRLLVTDTRTGSSYELPITDGTVRALDLRQIKTDAEGKASFDGVPYGKLRIQVLASGFQTYGDDYSIDKPTVEITVKMKRPQGQYSIYEEHPGDKKDEPAKPQ